jgi:cyclic pyranopterin phosphate synthase
MVGVGAKAVTHRIAEAEARVRLPAAVADALRRSGHRTRKGPVFDTAILAGVMAAKRTADLIPFCHPLSLEHCQVSIDFGPQSRRGATATKRAALLLVRCRVEVHHKTGVEMEALTGATVAALTIYDMCKALSHDIRIEAVRLLTKSGGRRDVGQPAAPTDSAGEVRP